MINKEFVEKYWDILTALKEGKQIQYFSLTRQDWADCDILDDYGRYKFRVKPEKFLKINRGRVKIDDYEYHPVTFFLEGKQYLLFVNKNSLNRWDDPIELTHEECFQFSYEGLSETWLKEKIDQSLEVLE